MKCVSSAVWLAVFLLTAGAAGEGDGLARILRDSSQQFLRLYREILCEKPCSLIETCQQGRFVYLGGPQDSLGADPVWTTFRRMCPLCVHTKTFLLMFRSPPSPSAGKL